MWEAVLKYLAIGRSALITVWYPVMFPPNHV